MLGVQLGGLRGLGQGHGGVEMWGSFPWESFLGSLDDELCPQNQEFCPQTDSFGPKPGAASEN